MFMIKMLKNMALEPYKLTDHLNPDVDGNDDTCCMNKTITIVKPRIYDSY